MYKDVVHQALCSPAMCVLGLASANANTGQSRSVFLKQIFTNKDKGMRRGGPIGVIGRVNSMLFPISLLGKAPVRITITVRYTLLSIFRTIINGLHVLPVTLQMKHRGPDLTIYSRQVQITPEVETLCDF